MTRARSLSQLANPNVFTVATNNRVGIGSEHQQLNWMLMVL